LLAHQALGLREFLGRLLLVDGGIGRLGLDGRWLGLGWLGTRDAAARRERGLVALARRRVAQRLVGFTQADEDGSALVAQVFEGRVERRVRVVRAGQAEIGVLDLV